MTTASGHTSAIRAKKVIGTDVNDRSGTTKAVLMWVYAGDDFLPGGVEFGFLGLGGDIEGDADAFGIGHGVSQVIRKML